MNTLIFFLAGISLGLVTDKVYHYFVVNKKHTEEGGKEGRSETIKEKVPEVKQQEPARTIPGGAEGKHDDLRQLKGVGPKLADALDELGIDNYEQLASSSVDMLLEQLRKTGGRFSKSAISSIVGRAQLAAN